MTDDTRRTAAARKAGDMATATTTDGSPTAPAAPPSAEQIVVLEKLLRHADTYEPDSRPIPYGYQASAKVAAALRSLLAWHAARERDALHKALLYVSAELRHMRLTHQLGPHTVHKVDSLIRHCERATTPIPEAPHVG